VVRQADVIRSLRRRKAAQIDSPLGAEIDAGAVDDQRTIGEALLDLEHEDAALARAHRNFDAEAARQPDGARGARRVDEGAAMGAIRNR
jgi:hypothetical protein